MKGAFIYFILAVVFLVAATLVTPEHLISIGVMDQSLTSENLLTRETALATVTVAQTSVFAFAAFFFVCALAMPQIEKTQWYQRREKEGSCFPVQYEENQRRVLNVTAGLAFAGLCAAIFYISFGTQLFRPLTLVWINQEDGFLETLSALILLAASLLSLGLSLRMPSSANRNMLLFLAVLFFVMFGEEVSWGQRLLSFETPEQLAQVNVQNEVNFHNMFGYLFDHLFILCFFLWGCVVPVLYWSSPIWRWHQSRLGLPFPSVGLAIAMLFVTLCQHEITDVLFGSVPGLRVAELRETLSALCLFLIVVEARKLSEAATGTLGLGRNRQTVQ
ncbi:MAG: hypothetical protein QNJ03_03000 [Dinoroseobacter sp.]|nr:hypothetical protein [Dinoroseobacter sp.]